MGQAGERRQGALGPRRASSASATWRGAAAELAPVHGPDGPRRLRMVARQAGRADLAGLVGRAEADADGVGDAPSRAPGGAGRVGHRRRSAAARRTARRSAGGAPDRHQAGLGRAAGGAR